MYIIANNKYKFIGVFKEIKTLNQVIVDEQLDDFYLVDYKRYKEHIQEDIMEEITKSFETLIQESQTPNIMMSYNKISGFTIEGFIQNPEHFLKHLPKYSIFINHKVSILLELLEELMDIEENMFKLYKNIELNTNELEFEEPVESITDDDLYREFRQKMNLLIQQLFHEMSCSANLYLVETSKINDKDLTTYIQTKDNPHVTYITTTNQVDNQNITSKKASYQSVEDGLFLVRKDGVILRRQKNNTYTIANQTTNRNNYKTVTAMVNGSQKSYYVHRLVAEAFIPNTLDKKNTIFLDGDATNVHADNLQWATDKERVQHSYSIGQMNTLERNGVPCPNCGKPMLYGPVCSDCTQDQVNLKGRLQTKQKHRDKLRNAFENIEKYKPRYQKVIRRRFRGDLLKSISVDLGVTHQYVSLLQKQILENDPAVFIK